MYALKVTVVELDLSSLKLKTRRNSGGSRSSVQSGLEFFKKKSPRKSSRSPKKVGKSNEDREVAENKLQLDPYVCVKFRDKVFNTGKLKVDEAETQGLKTKWRWDEEFIIDLSESLDVLVATGAYIDIVSKTSIILNENELHLSPPSDSKSPTQSPKHKDSTGTGCDTVLGGVRIPLGRLSTERKVEQWYELSYTEDYAAAYGKYIASVWRNLTNTKGDGSSDPSESVTRQSCGGVLLLG
eukprot:CAMPEP_0204831904 /NCGR_PEP_ID=MMETSP1346-20131115/12064_1 /ASSEMBLY_ACC=CAM_ASM_000771 /TAXON_ID=215587 /ORGANISM="Aplanochytrium stocchinoi, Strain GSBS06" /LENGTH=239 /DNA_ID=CAMNT_0051963339 /DNA_START=27 /DNA_END=742 /DNA_ORIENTATION=-